MPTPRDESQPSRVASGVSRPALRAAMKTSSRRSTIASFSAQRHPCRRPPRRRRPTGAYSDVAAVAVHDLLRRPPAEGVNVVPRFVDALGRPDVRRGGSLVAHGRTGSTSVMPVDEPAAARTALPPPGSRWTHHTTAADEPSPGCSASRRPGIKPCGSVSPTSTGSCGAGRRRSASSTRSRYSRSASAADTWPDLGSGPSAAATAAAASAPRGWSSPYSTP